MTALVVENVRHPLGPQAALAIDRLDVARGERLVVFGPNGAGKTTLLRVIAGTLPGGPATAAAYLPQRPYLFRGKARWNLHLGLEQSERDGADQLAETLGVSGALDRQARLLSGGERQRLVLARTLAQAAPVVLLDEPLAALDVRDRPSVAATIVAELDGKTAVIVTHDREAAASLAETVAVLVDGAIIQSGPIGDVLSLPGSEAAAAALGIGNVLEGEAMDQDGPLTALKVGPLTVWGLGEISAGRRGRALFGAESVVVYAGEGDAGSARNTWTGAVAEMRTVGRLVEIIVDCGATVVALVTPGARDALGLAVGSSVTVAVKATAVRLL